MARITIQAWMPIIYKDHIDNEEVENLKLDKKRTWTTAMIAIEDILMIYEYNENKSSTKSVIEFSDGRPLMIVKESFESLCKRIEEAEYQFYIKYYNPEADSQEEQEETQED